MDPIRKLATHFAAARYEDLSSEAREAVKMTVLDTAGAALAGSSSEPGYEVEREELDAPDRRLDRPAVAHRQLRRWVIDLDDMIDARDMDEAIAKRARHLSIDLGDDCGGRKCRRLADANFEAKRAEAIPIGRRHVDDRNVELELTAAQLRDLRQKDRGVIHQSLIDRRAQARADKQRIETQVLIEPGPRIAGFG